MGNSPLLQVSSNADCKQILPDPGAAIVSQNTLCREGFRSLCLREGAICAGDSAKRRCPLRPVAR